MPHAIATRTQLPAALLQSTSRHPITPHPDLAGPTASPLCPTSLSGAPDLIEPLGIPPSPASALKACLDASVDPNSLLPHDILRHVRPDVAAAMAEMEQAAAAAEEEGGSAEGWGGLERLDSWGGAADGGADGVAGVVLCDYYVITM